MSTQTRPKTHPAETTPIEEDMPPVPTTRQVLLEEPPRAHVYVPIPEDIPRRAITSPGLHGICRIDSGNLVDELDGHLQELIQAVQTLGKKGKLKLTLEVAPGGHNRVAIAYDVTSAPPREKRHPYPIFTTSHGQLVGRDPDQMEMDLRSAVPPPVVSELRRAEPPAPRKTA